MCLSLFLCLAPPLSLYILFLLLILIAAGKCCWPSVQSIGQVSSSVLRISSLHMGKLYGSRWLKWVTTTLGAICHRKCRKAAAALTSCSCWAMCRHLKLSAGFFDDDRKKENIIPFIFFCCLTTLVVAEALPSAMLIKLGRRTQWEYCTSTAFYFAHPKPSCWLCRVGKTRYGSVLGLYSVI